MDTLPDEIIEIIIKTNNQWNLCKTNKRYKRICNNIYKKHVFIGNNDSSVSNDINVQEFIHTMYGILILDKTCKFQLISNKNEIKQINMENTENISYCVGFIPKTESFTILLFGYLDGIIK